jgi:hypothetical protein
MVFKSIALSFCCLALATQVRRFGFPRLLPWPPDPGSELVEGLDILAGVARFIAAAA